MIVYGRNAVREVLRGPRTVRTIWASEGAAKEPWLAGNAQLTLTDDDQIAELCRSSSHQGVCADVTAYKYRDSTALLDVPEPFLVVLDQLQDPQNLGAICRTAECAGVTGLAIAERRSVEVTPAVCKASAGAVEHLQIARVRNIADFLIEAKQAGVWCYGASSDGRQSYDKPDYSGGVAIVLGAEGAGIRPRVAVQCDELVAIPLAGQIESLNVSAAAAVLLYKVRETR